MGHLQENGFEVELHEVADIMAHQERAGVPAHFRGCHSAMAGDYMVEGHVPADLIKKFLAEDDGLAGITVPGMVVGPPGMEGSRPVPFKVYTWDHDGTSEVYAERPGNVRPRG